MSWQIVNGEIGEVTGFDKVLPLGAYIESYRPHENTGDILAAIDAANDCQMNLIYLRISDSEPCRQLIDRAISYGMKIGIEPNGPLDAECVEIVGLENTAFLLNQDDQENKSPEECEARFKALKTLFPAVPVYSTGYKTEPDDDTPDPIGSRQWADISAQQAYVTGQADDVVGKVFELYTEAESIAPVSFANPQCYHGYTQKLPTKKLIVEMGLAALLRCKGLLWYTFYNAEMPFTILDHPEWLEGVKIVCDFARAHEELLLGE